MKGHQRLRNIFSLLETNSRMFWVRGRGSDYNGYDRLEAFLHGVYLGHVLSAEGESETVEQMRAFEIWLGELLFGCPGEPHWFVPLLDECGGDRDTAYRKFFKYFLEYLQQFPEEDKGGNETGEKES